MLVLVFCMLCYGSPRLCYSKAYMGMNDCMPLGVCRLGIRVVVSVAALPDLKLESETRLTDVQGFLAPGWLCHRESLPTLHHA